MNHPAVRLVPLRSELTALLALTVIWIAMAALIHPVGNFPLNDDWVYSRAVRLILQTGRFALPSAASANVIGQAYWGALFCLPFGFSFNALRASTLLLGWAGVLALFLLLRELGAGRTVAAVGAATLACNPIYLVLAATFMTDVPFTALFTIALFLYTRGARRGEAALLAGAYAVAFAAISVRQFGLVLLVGFGAAHIARKGFGAPALAAAMLPVLAAVALQLEYDHWMIASGRTPVIPVPLGELLPVSASGAFVFVHHIANRLPALLAYPGLLLAPFWACLALARRPAAPPARRRLLLAARSLLALGCAGFLLWHGTLITSLRNILIPSGIGPLTLRDTFELHVNMPVIPVFAHDLWVALTLLSAVLSVLVVWQVAATGAGVIFGPRRPDDWLVILPLTVIAAYGAGTIMALGANGQVFDRYMLPLVPAAAALLVAQPGFAWRVRPAAARLVPAILLLVIFAGFGVPAAHDYLAWNRARWRATGTLLASGVPASRIDGGYEFGGWYLYRPDYQLQPDKSFWWVADDTYVIASGPLPGYAATARFHFDRWLGSENSNVFVLRRLPAAIAR